VKDGKGEWKLKEGGSVNVSSAGGKVRSWGLKEERARDLNEGGLEGQRKRKEKGRLF